MAEGSLRGEKEEAVAAEDGRMVMSLQFTGDLGAKSVPTRGGRVFLSNIGCSLSPLFPLRHLIQVKESPFKSPQEHLLEKDPLSWLVTEPLSILSFPKKSCSVRFLGKIPKKCAPS